MSSVFQQSEALKDQGNAYMKTRDYEKALNSYTEAIALTNDNCILYSNRSQAYINLKRYEEGKLDAEKTIELKPDWFKGYSHKATALARLGLWEEVLTTAKKGLDNVTRDADAVVLLQNITIARAGLFEAAVLGKWQGRVSNAMGGYRQAIEFLPRGELTVSIMHRKQECKYTVRPLDDPLYFIVYFTLPFAETKTPYIARYLAKDESESGEEELLLCCNADITRSSETPTPADLEKREADGYVLMTRWQAPKQDETMKTKSLSIRLKKFAEKYREILESRNAGEWSEKSVSEPGVMVQALKFQSDIFDLEESVGKDVVDPFFLIAAGVDDEEADLPGKIAPDTREAILKVKDALMERKMLDESLLQQKKEVFLQFKDFEKKDGKNKKKEEGGSILDKITKYPATSLCIAGSVLLVSALAIGYLSSKKKIF